jgi:hypothetical protein
MSLCALRGFLGAANLLHGTMVTKFFKVMKVIADFDKLQLTLDTSLSAKVGFSLGNIGIELLIAVNHLIVSSLELI